MAISDGLICQIYPVAGETAIKNIVDGSTLSGTGTPTLVDEGGEKAWSITTGTLLTAAVPAKNIIANSDGGGVTIAVRFKATSNGSGADFLTMIGVKDSADNIESGVRITRNGNDSFRGRRASGFTASLASMPLNNIYTLVYTFELANPANDFGRLWRDTVGRVGTDANASSPALTAAIDQVFNQIFINCQNSVSFLLLDFAYFNIQKPAADCSAIADNYRAVMPAPSGGTTPIAFTGTIPAQTFTNGQAVSVNLSGYFSGTQTPFTFANTGAALTGTGLSITSAGLLSGTATTDSVSGVVITGTDASSNTAASNAFNVTVNAAATPVSFTGTVPTLSGTQNSTIAPVDLSTYFSGSLTPFTYSLFSGTLPSGVTLNSSTGIISGTPTVSFSGNIVVRVTDTGSNVANSNSIAVNIAAATTDGTITLADLKNNTATPLASTSGFYVTILSATNPKSVVYNTASVSSNASAVITFTNAAIVQGTEYRYFIEKDGVAFAAGKVTAT